MSSFTGTVTLTARGTSKANPVETKQFLKVGDRLETGDASTATLALRNQGQLKVEPNSVVLFRSSETDKKLSLLLQQGSVVGAASNVQAAELMIAVGKKTIRLSNAAKVKVATKEGGEAEINVSLGEATIEGPGGESHTLVSGKALVIPLDEPLKPDAGPPPPDAAVEPPQLKQVFFLRPTRGRVLVKPPGAKRFVRARRRWAEIPPGSMIKLARRARARFGPEKDRKTATLLVGPGLVRVKELTADQSDESPLEYLKGDVYLTKRGKPGDKGASVTIDGVTITPRVVHQKVDIRVQRQGNRHIVKVSNGEASLKGKRKELVLEAGQDAAISRGSIVGPRMLPQSPFKIRNFGTVRVFTSDRKLPVTFRWKDQEGSKSSLVQVSRYASMAKPLFADVIKRNVLTIPDARRGALFWRVAPVGADGKQGETKKGALVLVRDTSYRVLTDIRTPRNTIREAYGNTTVYYQNRLPRFTFTWKAIEGATRYNLKIFREQNLTKPLVNIKTKRMASKLKPGMLKEGTYIWYVVGRDNANTLVRALKGRKLSVRYDNATPDLQIVYPRNGIAVGSASIEAKGVAIPGSKVFINGAEVTLDRGSRFKHSVKLNQGVNFINFRVKAPRRGFSIYLRRVTRR